MMAHVRCSSVSDGRWGVAGEILIHQSTAYRKIVIPTKLVSRHVTEIIDKANFHLRKEAINHSETHLAVNMEKQAQLER